jgi:hypothetical protein
LANQTLIIRRDAISDLYLSSEAYDDYGPEHRNDDGSYNRAGYKNHIKWQIADPHTWEILECFAYDGVGLEDFEEADVKRVEKLFHISDEGYAQLVADGHIKVEDLEREKAKMESRRINFSMRPRTSSINYPMVAYGASLRPIMAMIRSFITQSIS